MAYVKILRGRNIFDLNKYILLGRDQSDPILNNNCFGENVADQMYLSQLMHGKRDMDAIHIVQSFDGKDSKKLSPEEYTKIGHEMVKKMFPDHEFIVVTHTDTEQTHNHIMLNPCHPETGLKIPNKKRLLYDLRDLSDKIGSERGLSVIESQSILNWENMTETVRAINKRGGFSWIIDLQEKCDFAKTFATSFDEYAGILNQFGIQVRVENKNIQYIYPNRRSKRGGTKGLGDPYTKEGLIEKFRENYEDFYNKVLKHRPIENVNFLDSWKFHRDQEKYIVPEYRYKELILPVDAFKKIGAIDLKSYCEKNNIEFLQDGDGFCLKDKPNIKFKDDQWFNSEKKTSGTALEFISYLKQTDFLSVLSEFDDSKKISSFLKDIEVKKPSFQAFYFKPEVKEQDLALQVRRMRELGFSGKSLSKFLKSSKVKFYNDDRVKLTSFDSSRLSLTFYKTLDGWSCKKNKGLNQFFYKHLTKTPRKTLIFQNPIDFLKNKKMLDLLDESSFSFNVFVPMKPVGLFLTENEKQVKEMKNVFVVKPNVSVAWSDKQKQVSDDFSKILFEKNIGYESIDDLLKDILTRSREN